MRAQQRLHLALAAISLMSLQHIRAPTLSASRPCTPMTRALRASILPLQDFHILRLHGQLDSHTDSKPPCTVLINTKYSTYSRILHNLRTIFRRTDSPRTRFLLLPLLPTILVELRVCVRLHKPIIGMTSTIARIPRRNTVIRIVWTTI